MNPVQEFQKKNGAAYAKIVVSPAFNDGMYLLNAEKLKKITILTDEEIAKNAVVILADLRGHLQHELNLATLHSRKSFDLSDLPAEDYSPEEPPANTKRTRKSKD